MSDARYLRDTVIFAPCYIALDWASYIDPLAPFNITPWNPQPALAIAWMLLAGMKYAPVVFGSIVVADIMLRPALGGTAIILSTALALTIGYAAIAAALRRLMPGHRLLSTRDLTLFAGVVVAGTALIGATFVGLLGAAGLIGPSEIIEAWLRFWIGDAVGVLVTGPLLLAVVDPGQRATLARLARSPEPWLQAAVLAATLWMIFPGLGGDPSRHFYLLFVPLIWIAARSRFAGAVIAVAIVQIGVVLGVSTVSAELVPVVELQALVAAFTLTGLYLGMMVDERERAAASLRESLRLAAAGEMAGAIAHELNQPLTALANYGHSAQLLLAREPGSAQLGPVIERMLAESQRAAEVVRRLRDLFRAGTTRLERIEPALLAASAKTIGEQLIGTRAIRLEAVVDADVPALQVDRLQIELVLRNLLANAVDSLEADARSDARIELRISRRGAGQVRLTVTDNGPGPRAAARLFEPFISGRANGMGLGLSVSRAIAEAHGGSLEAGASGFGEFHLLLPCPSAK